MKKFLCLFISLICAFSLFTSCSKSENEPEKETSVSGKEEFLSSFSTSTLDGDVVDESILNGKKLTMINIWATYCGPCINEMPSLGEISKEYEDKGLQIIGIPIDVVDYYGGADEQQIKLAKEIIEETGADYIHILPSVSLNEKVLNSVTAVPETIFVDEEGNFVHSLTGARSKEDWQSVIDELLEQVS